jgi:hypothetical protein
LFSRGVYNSISENKPPIVDPRGIFKFGSSETMSTQSWIATVLPIALPFKFAAGSLPTRFRTETDRRRSSR